MADKLPEFPSFVNIQYQLHTEATVYYPSSRVVYSGFRGSKQNSAYISDQMKPF